MSNYSASVNAAIASGAACYVPTIVPQANSLAAFSFATSLFDSGGGGGVDRIQVQYCSGGTVPKTLTPAELNSRSAAASAIVQYDYLASGTNPSDSGNPLLLWPIFYPASASYGAFRKWTLPNRRYPVFQLQGAATAWAALTVYVVGNVVFDGVSNQQCIIAGTSGALAPSWNSTPGGQTAETLGPTWINIDVPGLKIAQKGTESNIAIATYTCWSEAFTDDAPRPIRGRRGIRAGYFHIDDHHLNQTGVVGNPKVGSGPLERLRYLQSNDWQVIVYQNLLPLNSGGNNYTTEFDAATSTFSAVLSRQDNKAISSSQAVMGAVLARQINLSLSASEAVFSGVVFKQSGKSLTASEAVFSGVTSKQSGKSLIASEVVFYGSSSRQGGKSLSASEFAFNGSVSKQVDKSIQASESTFSGLLNRLSSRAISASLQLFSGSLSKQTGQALNASMGFAAAVVKQAGLTLSGSIASFSGVISRQVDKAVSASLSVFSGLLQTGGSHFASFSASMANFSGKLSNSTVKSLSSSFGFSGSVSKQVSVSLNSSMQTFSGLLLKGSLFSKSFTASMSNFFGNIVNLIIPKLYPTKYPAIRFFGVTTKVPAIVLTKDNTIQLFEAPAYVSGTFLGLVLPPRWSPFGTPDGFGLLGQKALPGNLLVAPVNGKLSGKIYSIVALGDVTIPPSAVSAGFNLVLNQNYFAPDGQNVIVTSDVMATMPSGVSLNPGTSTWTLVCTLTGNGKGNGILMADYAIQIGNNFISRGKFNSNQSPFIEPVIQLSLGAQFSGSVSGSDVFQTRLTKFEIQNRSY